MNIAPAITPIPRRSLHDELVEHLRILITAGEFGPGDKVPEKALCDRFGVSRTPLREALKVLASEGLVTLTPNRGAHITAITQEEVEQAFPVMGALEALSGEIACRHVTDAEIATVRELHEAMAEHYRRGELGPYFRLNQRIHEAILEATRNPTLQATYRGLAGRLMGARYVANMTPERWAQALAEHDEILAALEHRDGPALATILKRHLANKLETVKDWIARQEAARKTA
jgi:DNA-binding GntR family transcriptional regulator